MGKQVKYMVLSKEDLLAIVEYVDRCAPNGVARGETCVVLHMEGAGKKCPGQVNLTDKDQKRLVYGWDV